jgi:hypothetical protein
MDNHHFDQLTRSLTTLVSRRAVAPLTVAGAIRVILGLDPDPVAAAKCVRPGKKCNPKQRNLARCCGGAKCRRKRCRCPRGRRPCGKRCCPRGQICSGNRCVARSTTTCPAGQTACDALCRNLQSDRNACGSCTTTCPLPEACVDGACICPHPLTVCDGECVTTAGDARHCGGCNQPCGPDEACSSGECCTRINRPCVTVDDHCCGSSTCHAPGGIGFGTCCVANGLACTAVNDFHCCSGNCVDGRCQPA